MSRSMLHRLAAPLLACAAVTVGLAAPASPTTAHAAGTPALDGTRSPQALLADGDTELVVALFSLPGCPYCEAVRRNYLRHLEGEVRGLRVVEYGIGDERAFAGTGDDGAPPTAAALAKSLGVRVAPTVVFLGAGGEELAERLVGYSSPDFYGAYLEARIASALARANE